MKVGVDPLSELYDIEGLDAISWWPLAMGWWMVLIVILLLVAGIVVIRRRKKAFELSWRNSTLKILSSMESDIPSQELVVVLSELIRRIAIYQYSRRACAGLTGKRWLQWLKEHDPEQFNWEEKASWLISSPYQRHGQSVSDTEIKVAINAIKSWLE